MKPFTRFICLFYRFAEAMTEAKAVDQILDSGDVPDEYSETNKPFLGVPFTTKEAMAIKGNLGYEENTKVKYF